MATQTWFREAPVEDVSVLAEVLHFDKTTSWKILYWRTGQWWYDTLVVFDCTVLRWRLLEPLTVEKEDKRRPEISALVALFTQLNGGKLDQMKYARAQCHVLLNNLKKMYPGHDPVHIAEALLRRAKLHPELKDWVTNFTTVNNNLVKITNVLHRDSDGGRNKLADGIAGLAH